MHSQLISLIGILLLWLNKEKCLWIPAMLFLVGPVFRIRIGMWNIPRYYSGLFLTFGKYTYEQFTFSFAFLVTLLGLTLPPCLRFGIQRHRVSILLYVVIIFYLDLVYIN